MRFSVTVAVTMAVAATLLGGLTACSSAPAAQPTPSPVSKATRAAANCTPSTATIQWSLSDALSDPLHPTYVATGVTLLDYTQGAPAATMKTLIPVATDIAYDSSDQIVSESNTSAGAWKKALITSVRLTGQVPTDFGGKAAPSGDSVTVDHTRKKFLDVEEQILTSVPFVITCAGEKPISGSVVGPASGAFRGELVGCKQKPGKHANQAEKIALELTSKYCTPAGQ